MRAIQKPALGVDHFFSSMVEKRRDAALQVRLKADIPRLREAEDWYWRHGIAKNLCPYNANLHAAKATQPGDMEDMYEFFRDGATTRTFYRSLLDAAPGKLCPFCHQRGSGTIDHHLPRASHGIFSVVPLNLVPCCDECNRKAGTKKAYIGRRMLHPYFDHIDEGDWLVAFLVDMDGLTVTYETRKLAGWSCSLNQAVADHFEMFDLGATFAAEANRALSTFAGEMHHAGLIGHPTEIARQARIRHLARRDMLRNAWDTILYKELAGSRWFCDIGIRHIRVP